MSGVDDAYRRYFYLVDGLGRLQRASLSNPISEENLRLGLIETGDSRHEAESKIEARVADARDRLTSLALMDMCAAFEADCRRRIPTGVGEARRAIAKHYNVPVMRLVRADLIKRPEDFRTLDAIFAIVEPHISCENAERLAQLRRQRNAVAHGQNDAMKTGLSLEQARAILNDVLELVFS